MKAQTEFISEMCVINVKDASNLSAVTNNAISKGWKILTNDAGQYADFSNSAGSGSWYIYLGYKTTTDWTKAVKMVGVLHQTTPANSNWTIVPAYSNTSGKGTACTANMNEGKGTPLYLFVKYDNGDASAAVTSLTYNTSGGSVPDYDNGSAPADFLLGTGSSKHIYLQLGYHEHSMTWVKTADGHSQKCSSCNCTTTVTAHTLSFSSPTSANHTVHCSECGYSASVAHNFVYAKHDDDQCKGTCSDCKYETLINHIISASYISKGDRCRVSCSRCRMQELRDHVYGPTSDYNDTQHQKTCTVCKHVNYTAHTYPDAWSYYTTEQHRKKCNDCEHYTYQDHPSHQCYNEHGHYQRCDDCGMNTTNTAVGFQSHNFVIDQESRTADCNAPGCTEGKHCSDCDYRLDSQPITVPHTIAFVPLVSAYCTTPGTLNHYRCTHCSSTFSDSKGTTPVTAEELVIPALGHLLTHHDAIAATCVAQGRVEYWDCRRCKYLFRDETCTEQTYQQFLSTFSDPNAHGDNISHHDAVPNTCETLGRLEYWECLMCKNLYSDEALQNKTMLSALNVPSMGHDQYPIAALDPTCTEPGHTAHRACTRCDAIFEAVQPYNKISNPATVVIAALGHRTGNYVYGKKPTCTTSGQIDRYYCSRCEVNFRDFKYTEPLSAEEIILAPLGHSIVDYTGRPTSSGLGMPAVMRCDRCFLMGSDETLAGDLTPTDIYPHALAGSGTEADPYLVSSEYDLQAIALASLAGWTGDGSVFRVTRDFDVTETYIPICNGHGKKYRFHAIFHGDYHTIHFADVELDKDKGEDGNTYMATGLFGHLVTDEYGKSSVDRLTVSGSWREYNIATHTYIGGICGNAANAEFNECRSFVNITTTAHPWSIGGIVGEANNVNFNSCLNYGTIKTTNKIATYRSLNAGGIVGTFGNSVKSDYANTISNCANYGDIDAEGYTQVGGIVGYGTTYSTTKGYLPLVENCFNDGTVKAVANNSQKSDGTTIYKGTIYGNMNGKNAGLGRAYNCVSRSPVYTTDCATDIGGINGTTFSDGYRYQQVECHSVSNTDNAWMVNALNRNATSSGGRLAPWMLHNGMPIMVWTLPADVNADQTTSISDVPALIDILRGQRPNTFWRGDVNNDGHTDIDDLKAITDSILD